VKKVFQVLLDGDWRFVTGDWSGTFAN